MEPGNSPDNSYNSPHQQQSSSTANASQHQSPSVQQTQHATAAHQPQSSLERLSRPLAFDKMEILVREMQDVECGVPVRSQKLFLTSIPSAFMGYDLIEWLMERLSIEESEALNIANQLCLHGYFFPVSDGKTLVVKDDSSLYRFQTPYYWPWQHKTPDNVEYAIYLVKRSLRNKQRHGLEDYEVDALASLHKNLKAKWDFITMQAEEQVKLSKDRKKGDKIVADSQERAFWRVHRPPPGQFTPLESCPVPSRDRQGKPRRRTSDDCYREVEYLKSSLGRTRIKMSQACEFLSVYWETFSDYDFFLQPALPSNPWVTEDLTFWQLNHSIVDVPTEKRVRRWAISIEELVTDPTGLQEFTAYLKKEYSHENIRFWIAVNDLRRSAHSQIARKVREIYEEFLEPGAPCEINIDSKTMERVHGGLKSPSRFTFDAASEHIYALLLKKDCYPRFIRSEHYKSLLATGIQPSHKKRFFGFGGAAKKKSSTTAPPNMALLTQTPSISTSAAGALSRRRGSDRSLTGSAHELAVCGVKDASNKVPHSHSQSNLSDIPYSVVIYRGDMPSGDGDAVSSCNKEVPNVIASTATGVHNASSKNYQEGSKSMSENMESSGGASAVCPWDEPSLTENAAVSVSVCPWDDEEPPSTSKQAIARSRNNSAFDSGSSSSDISEISERMRKTCGLRQNTLDCEISGGKRLAPVSTEPRRASITIAPRLCDMQFSFRQQSGPATTPSFDKPKKYQDVESIVHTTSCSTHTSTITTTTVSVPNVQNSPSAQSLPPPSKTQSFDDRDSLLTAAATNNNKINNNNDNNTCNSNTNLNIDTATTVTTIITTTATTTEDEHSVVDCCKDEQLTKTNPNNSENYEHDDNTNNKQIKTVVSVVLSKASDSNFESSSLLSDSKVQLCESVCVSSVVNPPNISINASPPIITVVCAPCTDDVIAETAAASVMHHEQQKQLSIESNESSAAGDIEITQTIEINPPVQSTTNICDVAGSPTPDTSNLLLSLDVRKCDIDPTSHEELSPSMDEYQECVSGEEYPQSGEKLVPGCIAPVPTPAPLMAPLAEVEIYPQDDDISITGIDKPTESTSADDPETATTKPQLQQQQSQTSRTKKKKQKSTDKGDGAQTKPSEDSSRNAVCPWEDEDGTSTSDGTFVKTYSTLGYL